jgi:hypothetical protein
MRWPLAQMRLAERLQAEVGNPNAHRQPERGRGARPADTATNNETTATMDRASAGGDPCASGEALAACRGNSALGSPSRCSSTRPYIISLLRRPPNHEWLVSRQDDFGRQLEPNEPKLLVPVNSPLVVAVLVRLIVELYWPRIVLPFWQRQLQRASSRREVPSTETTVNPRTCSVLTAILTPWRKGYPTNQTPPNGCRLDSSQRNCLQCSTIPVHRRLPGFQVGGTS